MALLGALSSPGLHSGLLELLTSFSSFQKVTHGQNQPTWLETSFPIRCHSPPHPPQPSAELHRVRWLPALYFSFRVGSSLSTAIPLKILLSHRGIFSISLTPPLHKCLMCHLPKLLSSPGNVWGMCMPSSRLCMCCCDRSIFLFRNPLFSLTIAF